MTDDDVATRLPLAERRRQVREQLRGDDHLFDELPAVVPVSSATAPRPEFASVVIPEVPQAEEVDIEEDLSEMADFLRARDVESNRRDRRNARMALANLIVGLLVLVATIVGIIVTLQVAG